MARYFSAKTFDYLDQLKSSLNEREKLELQQKLSAAKAHHHFYSWGVSAKQKAADQALVVWINQKLTEKFSKLMNFKFENDEAKGLVYALDDQGMGKIFRMSSAMRIAMQPGVIKKIIMGFMMASMLMSLVNPFGLGVAATFLVGAGLTFSAMILAKMVYKHMAKVDSFTHVVPEMQVLKRVDFGIRFPTTTANPDYAHEADSNPNPAAATEQTIVDGTPSSLSLRS
jgi:hypothetical protein